MKVVVIHSGGLDSTVLLYHCLASEQYTRVKALSFDYGQRHAKELERARMLCATCKVDQRTVHIPSVFNLIGGSALTDPAVDVPDGPYTEETMKATVVPNRNMIMLSIAAGWALSLDYQCVAFAAHAGDHAIYPDCRPDFCEAMDHVLGLCGFRSQVRLQAPFIDWSKADIVCRGVTLNVPFKWTWSCYRGGVRHCGLCATCLERKEAFKDAEVSDPTEYDA